MAHAIICSLSTAMPDEGHPAGRGQRSWVFAVSYGVRSPRRATYPARFQLVAAMNPCRCGRGAEPGYVCRRQPNERCMAQYQARISGPLLDRIDLAIDVPAVSAVDLILPPPVEGSKEVGVRVRLARERQVERYARLGLAGFSTNAGCPSSLLQEICAPDSEGVTLLHGAAEKMRLSARAFHRVLKVARTLADLDDEAQVRRIHIAEALSFRLTATDASVA